MIVCPPGIHADWSNYSCIQAYVKTDLWVSYEKIHSRKMEEVEAEEERVRVTRDGSAEGDKETVRCFIYEAENHYLSVLIVVASIEKSKTLRRTLTRPKIPGRRTSKQSSIPGSSLTVVRP